MINAYRLIAENLNVSDHFRDLGVDGWIILKILTVHPLKLSVGCPAG
jgi:hypothetical protein